MTKLGIAIFAGILMLVQTSAFAGTSAEEKMQAATAVLDAFVNIPENAIPPALLEQAYGIAIIPSVLKLGFILAGRHGTGVVAVRNKNGKWSNPSFMTLTGGSIGWQIGASSTDIILVFKTRRSVEDIANGDFTLGGDASIAAGPVGRSASAATNYKFTAEVYSYSRTRGLFAGVSLEGAALSMDDADNQNYYQNSDITPLEILRNSNADDLPASGQHLVQTLERYLPRPAQ